MEEGLAIQPTSVPDRKNKNTSQQSSSSSIGEDVVVDAEENDKTLMANNQTSFKDLHILAFSTYVENKPLLFLAFFCIYMLGVLVNLIIIILIYMDVHLHTPMYFLLSNLSFVDICYTTVTLPKLMDIILSGNNNMSFTQCFSQMCFFIFIASTEDLLLSSMAYDRYVAICSPLHYHSVMNKKRCILLLGGIWISGCVNALFVTGFASKLLFCHSNEIHHFFCDVKSLAQISCADTTFHMIIYVETLLLGLCPLLLNLISYLKIIIIIMSFRSMGGRRKAFSTCSSHLMVLIIFYGTIVCMYMRPPSAHSVELDELFSIFYAAVIPMLNPLIYSVRNKEVKQAFRILPFLGLSPSEETVDQFVMAVEQHYLNKLKESRTVAPALVSGAEVLNSGSVDLT
ncbi:olfactory receptor 1C1-like [Rhinophrynus dorsalis]